MTDLCWECQHNNRDISSSSILPDVVKQAKLKDNAHYLNSPMKFTKNGDTCCLDTNTHDEIKRSRGHHAHYATTAHYIITIFYSLFLQITLDGSLSVLLLVYVYISYWTMTRKSIPVHVVAYKKG